MGNNESKADVEDKIHMAISWLCQSREVSKKTKYQVTKWAAAEYKEMPERQHLALPHISPPTADYLEVEIDDEKFDCSASCLLKFQKKTFVLNSKVAHVKLYFEGSKYSLLLEANHNNHTARVVITREKESSEIQMKLRDESFEMSSSARIIKESKCPQSSFSNVLEWLHNNKDDFGNHKSNESLFHHLYGHLMKGSIVLVKKDSHTACHKEDLKNKLPNLTVYAAVKEKKKVLLKTENDECIAIYIQDDTIRIEYNNEDCASFNNAERHCRSKNKRIFLNRRLHEYIDWLYEFDSEREVGEEFEQVLFNFSANESFQWRQKKCQTTEFIEVSKVQLKEKVNNSLLKRVMRDGGIAYMQRCRDNTFLSIEVKADGIYVTSEEAFDEVSPDTRDFEQRINFPSGNIYDCFDWLQSNKRNKYARNMNETSNIYLESLLTKRCSTSFKRMVEENKILFSIFTFLFFIFLCHFFPSIGGVIFGLIRISAEISMIALFIGSFALYFGRDNFISDFMSRCVAHLRPFLGAFGRLLIRDGQ